MSWRLTVAGELKPVGGGVAKASPNRAIVGRSRPGVRCRRPETQRASPGQAEAEVTLGGGPNRLEMQILRMSWG